jgi:hypothetical protein
MGGEETGSCGPLRWVRAGRTHRDRTLARPESRARAPTPTSSRPETHRTPEDHTDAVATVLELDQRLADHAIVNPPETDRVCPVT